MSSGAWSHTTGVLPNGEYTFTATGKNAAGQESSPSAARNVTVLKTAGPTPPSINPEGGCAVSATTSGFVGFVPAVPSTDTGFPPTKCLDGRIPVRGVAHAVVQQVDINFNDPPTSEKIDPPRTYPVTDEFSDRILRINITDPLPSGTHYHLTSIVSDEAGNESCVESFAFVGENTGCTESSSNTVLSVGPFLQ